MKQAQANVESAKINLGYATVVAPISGRAGQQQVTEGALVGQSDATLLTTVEQIDPLYVNFSQAVSELDKLKSEAASGTAELSAPNTAKIELMRGDGNTYGVTGTLDFSDAAVDAATGAVNLRGIVPNPNHSLLPGTFVNVRVTVGELKHAYIVPQAVDTARCAERVRPRARRRRQDRAKERHDAFHARFGCGRYRPRRRRPGSHIGLDESTSGHARESGSAGFESGGSGWSAGRKSARARFESTGAEAQPIKSRPSRNPLGRRTKSGRHATKEAAPCFRISSSNVPSSRGCWRC